MIANNRLEMGKMLRGGAGAGDSIPTKVVSPEEIVPLGKIGIRLGEASHFDVAVPKEPPPPKGGL